MRPRGRGPCSSSSHLCKYPCPVSSPPSSYVLDDGTGSAEVKQFLDGDTARVRGLPHESRLSLSPHALILRRRWARHGPPWLRYHCSCYEQPCGWVWRLRRTRCAARSRT